ncbi:MAG: alpha/beta fold hydrolase [Caulobacteraceae bacterium]
MSGSEIRKISVGTDTSIVVRIMGEGPTVALVPSWARGASDFDPLARALADAGYRALAVNPRGIEGSAGPMEGLTTWDAADDVAAAVEALGGAPAFVLGHAGGNRVARALATRRPELVRGVILLAAGGLHRDEAKFSLFARETMFAEPSREAFTRVMHASGFFAAASDPSIWLDGWWRATAKPQSEANRAVDPKKWWAGGGKPMLVIQGLEDGIAPPANGRDLASLYPDRVRLVEIENAGHALLPEQPGAIARAVIEWLDEQGA